MLETDDKGRIKLSMKALLDRPPREERGERPPRGERPEHAEANGHGAERDEAAQG